MSIQKSSLARQVEKEHECLKRDLGDIQNELRKEISAAQFPDWRMEFVWRLRDFKNHLMKHFDLEEDGGFMSEIINEKPEAMSKVRKLEAEHNIFASSLDGIMTDLKLMRAEEISELDAIRNRVLQLITDLHAHEEAENRLIQSVYCREYGYPA